jgi:GH25 family lysozyme M1 (1,4-beta-N-acetylmuramidase)
MFEALGLAAPTWPVQGIDVSSWNGQIDWNVVKSKVAFAFIRASAGIATLDPMYQANVLECERLGIPFGAYHYLKPDKDFKKQADVFADLARGPLPPVIDVETDGGLDKSALGNYLEKFVKRVEVALGREVAIYTSKGFWDAEVPLTNWAKNRKLWIAAWTSAPSPALPKEWVEINQPRDWEFWQWSSKGDGPSYGCESTHVDLNRYNGSLAEFEAEYKVIVTNPPPPVEPPVPGEGLLFQVGVPVLNIRSGPGTQYNDIGDLHGGDVIAAMNVAGANSWIEIEPGKWACVQMGNTQFMVRK